MRMNMEKKKERDPGGKVEEGGGGGRKSKKGPPEVGVLGFEGPLLSCMHASCFDEKPTIYTHKCCRRKRKRRRG